MTSKRMAMIHTGAVAALGGSGVKICIQHGEHRGGQLHRLGPADARAQSGNIPMAVSQPFLQ
jgi:hypothetical protein